MVSWVAALKQNAKRLGSSDDSFETTTIKATKLSLRMLNATLDGVPVPGLKGAVNGLIMVMDNIDLEDSTKRTDGTSSFPATLEKAITSLVEGITQITNETVEIASHKLQRRILDNSWDAQVFLRNVRQINLLLQRFQSQAILALSITVKENTETMAQVLSSAQQYILDKLPVAEGALYNSSEREFASRCQDHTRIAVRDKIQQWIFDPNAPPLFWLCGLAGTGKSTIAQSVAESCVTKKCLAATFFFSRDKVIHHTLDLFFTTLARQLGVYNPRLNPHLVECLKADPSLPQANMRHQFLHLVAKPIKILRQDAPDDLTTPMVIIIDALDECQDSCGVSRMLSILLTELVGLAPLKIFLTSRPEPHINSSFNEFDVDKTTQTFVLHDIERDVVQDDIRMYLERGFQIIRDKRSSIWGKCLDSWPSQRDVQMLVERSAGLFIYASTMLKFVDNENETPYRQLRLILGIGNKSNAQVHTSLDYLYRHILLSCSHLDYVDTVVGIILLAFNPLTLRQLDSLLQFDAGKVRLILQHLHSVLLIPREESQPVRLFHPSFYDFLTIKERSGEHYIDPSFHHAKIARLCISMIQKILSEECDFHSSDSPKTQALKYACCNWTLHLLQAHHGGASLLIDVHMFISSSYRPWVEALKKLGELASVLLSLENLCDWVFRTPEPPIGFTDLLKGHLDDLGHSFSARFDYLGDVVDIHRAVSAYQAAVKYSTSDAKLPLRLHHLGIALRIRSKRVKNISDLERSLILHRNAVQQTGARCDDYHVYLTGLAIALRLAFRRSNVSAIDESISILHQASELISDHHPNKAPCLNSFAISLQVRFKNLGAIQDLDRAIETHAHAVRCAPDTHPAKATYLINLGMALLIRFKHYNNAIDVDMAIATFREAAEGPSGAPSVRFKAAANYARCIGSSSHHQSAMDAYSYALASATCVPWSELDVHLRRWNILHVVSFAHEAAAVAIVGGHLAKAVEWAEQGCSIAWVNGLQICTSFEKLKTPVHALSTQMERTGRALEAQGGREPLPVPQTSNPRATTERAAQQHRDHCLEWAQLLAESQTRPEFVQFKLPKTIDTLEGAASQGAVVILNTSQARCDALILSTGFKPNNLIDVQLPLTYDHLIDLAQRVRDIWSCTGLGFRGAEPEDAKGLLRDLWILIAKPILDVLSLQPSQDPPRLWWCPTGLFTRLPLHAATSFDPEAPLTLSDFVISSYTPSLDSLTRTLTQVTQKKRLLGVGFSEALSGTSQIFPGKIENELSFVRGLLPKNQLTMLIDTEATLNNVERELRNCSALHFASKVWERDDNPLESVFTLPGGECLSLSRLVRGPVPSFAYLSTGSYYAGIGAPFPSRTAFDLLVIGFRSVVAAQGLVREDDATKVAENFYTELFKLGNMDFGFSAKALHLAVKKLRNEGMSIDGWIHFIHVGN